VHSMYTVPVSSHLIFCWMVRCEVNCCVCASGSSIDLSFHLFLFPNYCQLNKFIFYFFLKCEFEFYVLVVVT
jgi:hypothetical protein